MDLIDMLVAADRIVIAGLSVYDTACARALNDHADLRRKSGEGEKEIAEALEAHQARITKNRGILHRELWQKALAQIASSDSAK